MNVASLPSEMLESVLKYIEFTELFQLRKINNRVDKIAKKARLTRLPVLEIVITRHSPAEYRIRVVMDFRISSYFHFPSRMQLLLGNEAYIVGKFSSWIEKVKITSNFKLIGGIKFDQKILTVMLKNNVAFKYVKQLWFDEVEMVLTENELKNFMKISRHLESLRFYSDKPCNALFNTQVLGNRKWSAIALYLLDTEITTLDDQFLLNVVANCDIFFLNPNNVVSNFTLQGVISLWAICFSGGDFQCRDLDEIKLGGVSFADADSMLNDLPGFVSKIDDSALHRRNVIRYVLKATQEDYKRFVTFYLPIPM